MGPHSAWDASRGVYCALCALSVVYSSKDPYFGGWANCCCLFGTTILSVSTRWGRLRCSSHFTLHSSHVNLHEPLRTFLTVVLVRNETRMPFVQPVS